MVPASRKLGAEEARQLIRDAKRVVVAKGKSVREFPGGNVTAVAVEALLGPTGNLRAPTLRVGGTVLVGFDHETYADVLGGS